MNVKSVYAPQVRLEESIERKLCQELDDIVQNITMNEKLYIKGTLNGHVGVCISGYENVHGGFRNETRNRR